MSGVETLRPKLGLEVPSTAWPKLGLWLRVWREDLPWLFCGACPGWCRLALWAPRAGFPKLGGRPSRAPSMSPASAKAKGCVGATGARCGAAGAGASGSVGRDWRPEGRPCGRGLGLEPRELGLAAGGAGAHCGVGSAAAGGSRPPGSPRANLPAPRPLPSSTTPGCASSALAAVAATVAGGGGGAAAAGAATAAGWGVAEREVAPGGLSSRSRCSNLASQARSSLRRCCMTARSPGLMAPWDCMTTKRSVSHFRRSRRAANSSSAACRWYFRTCISTSSSTCSESWRRSSQRWYSQSERSFVRIWLRYSSRSATASLSTASASSWQRCCRARRTSRALARLRPKSSSRCCACRGVNSRSRSRRNSAS
mmetsp:Transcript_85433/g.264543  ORF Transcript_85433/g.264543 Transcript_85433/m.264543 type:complete len:368 (+) Transcript_85433:484-1587(+)